MTFHFKYKHITGTYTQQIWGSEKLFIEGKEIKKSGKVWELPGGTKIETKMDFGLFPKLTINSEEVKLITLKKWEWAFVLLPGLLVFLGGAVPAIIGISGIYFCLSIFTSNEAKAPVKILASIGYSIVGLIIVLLIAAQLTPVTK